MPYRRALRWFKSCSLWAWRLALFGSLTLVLLAGGTFLVLRYWLLPNIDGYRGDIEQALVRATHQNIAIGEVRGQWNGLRPRLALHDVRLIAATGAERLALGSIDVTLSWLSLVVGEIRLHTIELRRLNLDVRRDSEGQLWVAGIPLRADTASGAQSGLSDWLLRQHQLVLHDSTLAWTDENLGATPLLLSRVQLRIEKRLGAHRFSMRAAPPMEVASPLDMRGELHIGSSQRREAWHGEVYCQVGYANLAALRQWFVLPIDVSRGTGGMQVWLTIDRGKLDGLTTEVALNDVSVRLRADLPALDLSRVSGRLAWRTGPELDEVSAQSLAFTTPDGLQLPAADIRYKRIGRPEDPQARSEVRFDALNLAAVMRVIDRLPLDERLRAHLSEMRPNGTLRHFVVRWPGRWSAQARYAMQGSFERLTLAPSGQLPGFSGVSGELDANEAGGALMLLAGQTQLELPRVFVGPLPFDKLNAQVRWTMHNRLPLIHLQTVQFSSPHTTGSVTGTYQTAAGRPGRIDLTGTLTRAEGPHVWRYVPLIVDDQVRDWLRQAIVAGRSDDVRVRLRGELRGFPWADGKSGTFQVLARIEDGGLAYASGWPAVEGIHGELAVHGARLELNAPQARIYGTALSHVQATIDNLGRREANLEIKGLTQGSTQDVLRFIAHSPLERMLGGISRGASADGSGQLDLALSMPLTNLANVTVSGRYTFAGNTLTIGPDVPILEQLSGELAFTERDATVRKASATVLGMPTRFVVDRAPAGAVLVRATGRADVTQLRQQLGHGLLEHMSGATDWRATLNFKDKGYEATVVSDLRGIASTLPAPLGKQPDTALPLKLERRGLTTELDWVGFSVGTLLTGQLLVDRAPPVSIRRGELRLNAAAPAPQRAGLWLAGTVESLDADRWSAVLGCSSGGDSKQAAAGIDLRANRVQAFSRAWNDVRVQATRAERIWRGKLEAREASGNFTWDTSGPGVLTARLDRLYVPEQGPQMRAEPPVAGGSNLPTLDVTAEQFRFGERALGRLVLSGVPEGRDWRIRQLDLVSPEGRLDMHGVWQASRTMPVTRMEIQAEVADIGAYFARLRLPRGIKGGSGQAAAELSWAGPPYALDLPSLAGALHMQAKNGRFVQMEPGIGKLIGVVSLQALPRRASLDFRDVFSEGFAFDEIGAQASIAQGVAHTKDFRMVGTAAHVEMRGDVNLVTETQQLDVKVVPSMSESVALGAAIVNPAVGLATLLAQKALKNPIGQMAAFEYDIGGTWAEPVVVKKKRDQPFVRPGRQ